MSELALALLSKAATDNGFDVGLEAVTAGPCTWLRFQSSRCPVRVWLTPACNQAGPVQPGVDSNIWLALCNSQLAEELLVPTVRNVVLPPGAAVCLSVPDVARLHQVLHRTYQLGVSLPDHPLKLFQHAVAKLPTTTEAEREVIVRVGQDLFRKALLEYWHGHCAVTGLAVPQLLRASHLKPWADCERDAERLDVFNGFLLAAHLDAAFDQGFITFQDNGLMLVSGELDPASRALLGLDRPYYIALDARHRPYLAWHRQRVFRE